MLMEGFKNWGKSGSVIQKFVIQNHFVLIFSNDEHLACLWVASVRSARANKSRKRYLENITTSWKKEHGEEFQPSFLFVAILETAKTERLQMGY